MNEFATMSFCGLEIFDYSDLDGIEGHFQYNNVKFHLDSLKEFDGSCVEVYDDWKVVIWGEEGLIQKEFYIIENKDFRQKLYNKYPLT